MRTLAVSFTANGTNYNIHGYHLSKDEAVAHDVYTDPIVVSLRDCAEAFGMSLDSVLTSLLETAKLDEILHVVNDEITLAWSDLKYLRAHASYDAKRVVDQADRALFDYSLSV